MEVRGLLKKGLNSIEGKFKGEDLIISGPIGTFVSKEFFDLILKEKVIFTPSLRIEGEKGSLHIQGALELSKEIDIHITGDIPLDILQNLIPDIKGLKGQTELGVKLTGTLSNPLFHGEIKLSEGGFLIPPYNLRMDNIQGIIQLANQTAYINDITAETRGDGWIGLNGIVEYKNRAIHSFNLTADFDDLYIYKQNAYKGFLEGQLEWFGNPDFSMLIGDVQVKEARHVAYKDIIQFLLAKKREIETDDLLKEGVQKNWGQWLEETNLSIGLDLGEEFWVRSPFYNATLTGHLMIKGPFTIPWLDGDIKVREGDIIIGSQRFSVTSGIITLSNPTMNEPSINAVAYHDINSYRLRLSVFGPLNKPNLQFSSTPYLSQPEILNMVFFGLTTEEGQREGQESDIVSLMLSTTGRVLINVIGEDVSSYTGLDAMSLDFFPKDLFRLDIFNIQLEEEGGGVERLTLGKTLSKRLKIKYTRLKGEEQREIAEAEYMITDHLTLIGSQDDQGTYSLDLNIGLSF
jgi:autotransporter translocation and assembly factor TamB